MRTLRFVKSSAPYNVGEVATFEEEQAARLLKRGLAVDITVPRSEQRSPPNKQQRNYSKKRI